MKKYYFIGDIHAPSKLSAFPWRLRKNTPALLFTLHYRYYRSRTLAFFENIFYIFSHLKRVL